MASTVTMTVYLGSGDEGVLMEHQLRSAAARKEMKKSEYALYAIKEQIKRDEEALSHEKANRP